jgi:hypothetical protein
MKSPDKDHSFIERYNNIYSEEYFSKSIKCLVYSCQNIANIDAHVLQRSNNVLSAISENNHVYGYQLHSYGRFINFAKTGIKKPKQHSGALFRGICSKCDNQVFAPIEKNLFSVSNRNCVLLSYRAFLVQYYFTALNIRVFSRVLADTFISQTYNLVKYKNRLFWAKLKLRFKDIYKTRIESCILNDSKEFHFHVFSVPYLPICATACYTTNRMCEAIGTFKGNHDDILTYPLQFMHIVPSDHRSLFIWGYNIFDKPALNKYEGYILRLNANEMLKEISDIIVHHVESWFMSPQFYQTSIKPLEEKIVIEREGSFWDKAKDIGTNLFIDISNKTDPADINKLL